MPILKIETGSKNKILRTASSLVSDIFNPKIQKLILNMSETLAKTKNGIGLAAPQVGHNLRIFIVVSELSKETVFINPEIFVGGFLKEDMEEGCLSLPEQTGIVSRYKKLDITAQNQKGEIFSLLTQGLLARVIQHEIDHLNGILFIDKIKL